MSYTKHSELEGQHAFLSPSKYHWLNYDEEKLIDAYRKYLAIERGTRLHAFAAECINLGEKLPRNQKTLNMYVNDAIGYRMNPEQLLYYSDNCFGTTDAISFGKEKGDKKMLRIHDLKTGQNPAHMEQLLIYAALYCLEHNIRPADISTELRLYQSGDIIVHNPEPEEIYQVMDKIVISDKTVEKVKSEG